MERYVNAEAVERLILENLDGLSELIKTAEGTDREKLCFKEMGLVDAMAHLREAPTADVRENTHGHWFLRHYITPHGSIDMWVCSKCGQEFSYDEETGLGATDYCFCPNCGADMRGEKNG